MSEPAVAQPTAAIAKCQATLIAQFALRGFEVQQVSDGFMVKRWNLSKHCPDLSALATFSRQVGVKS